MSQKKKEKEKMDVEQTTEQTEEQTQDTAEENLDTAQAEVSEDDAANAEADSESKDPKDAQIEALKEQLVRNMAEFDNFRKRSEKEKSQMFDIGAKSVIEKILPVVDNFERGLGEVTQEDKENAFVQGMEQIYKQFITLLEETDVKPIEAVGKEFDADLHNAVMHGEDENYGENIISDEFQKGYMYKDTVVRHSMVKVMN